MSRFAIAIAIVAGVALGWLGKAAIDAAGGDVVVASQTAAGWLGDAGKVALGAVIGAFGAYIVARANRDENRRTRFHEDLRRVSTDLLIASERHRQQRQDQFSAWRDAADNGSGGPLPTVGDTQSIFDAAVALDVVANRQTAKAAWSVYGQSTYLDQPAFTYNAKRHGDVAGLIEGPSMGGHRAV